MTKNTILVSIMHTNNEVGAVQPIEQAGELIKRMNPSTLFHVDAVQGFGKCRIYPKRMHIDLLTVSAHKLHGPKGVGFLYINEKAKVRPIIFGGGQQKGMRSGTENVPGIVGMAKAAQMSFSRMKETAEREQDLRDRFIHHICTEIPGAYLVGDFEHRLPGNVNICFQGIEASNLVLLLDEAGVCVSAGSACNSASAEPSHVLKALGMSDAQAYSCIRMTLGRETTAAELSYTLKTLKYLVKILKKG